MLAPGGFIILSAKALDHLQGGVVKNSGTLEATGLSTKGGRIVLEASDEVGGAVRSAELVEPGFTSDLFSAFYPLAVASPAIRALGLEEHGLRWRRSALAFAHPTPGGAHAAVATDDLGATAATCASWMRA